MTGKSNLLRISNPGNHIPFDLPAQDQRFNEKVLLVINMKYF